MAGCKMTIRFATIEGGCAVERLGAMPTLVVGMLKTRKNYYMPTTSVGMAPTPRTLRNRNSIALTLALSRRERGLSAKLLIESIFVILALAEAAPLEAAWPVQ